MFQPYLINSYEIIVIDSRENKTIDLCCVDTENNTPACFIHHTSQSKQAVEMGFG